MKGLIPRVRLCIGAVLVLALPGVAAAQPLRVVTESATYTYMKDGKVAGSATEVVQASLQRAGFGPYEIELVPWARAYDTALKTPQVLIYLIARTPEREDLFQWVREIARVQYALFKLKDRTDIGLLKLEDARQHSIAVVRDDVRHRYLQSHGFNRLVVSAQETDGLDQLLKRRVDLLPLPVASLERRCRQLAADCSDVEVAYVMDELSPRLYMAFSRGTPAAWGERLGAAFDRLKAEGLVQKIMDQGP